MDTHFPYPALFRADGGIGQILDLTHLDDRAGLAADQVSKRGGEIIGKHREIDALQAAAAFLQWGIAIRQKRRELRHVLGRLARPAQLGAADIDTRSEEHTSEPQPLMRLSYAV